MPITIHRYDADSAKGIEDQIVEAFIAANAHLQHDPFYQAPRFRRQIEGHMAAPHWEMTVAKDDGRIVGFAYGFVLPPATAWWRGLISAVPEGFAEETGHRTFALSELNVLPRYRGNGIASQLYRELLSQRTEERATLLTEQGNEAARGIYEHWGWTRAASMRPSWEGAPVFDVFMLPLPLSSTGK